MTGGVGDVLTVGSLFTGIGGFDLGFERAGMRVVWQCEQDDYCRRVLARHWPEVPCYPDVCALVADTGEGGRRRWPDRDAGDGPLGQETERGEGVHQLAGGGGLLGGAVPVQVPYVDVLCGGFPCQDISLAGKGAGIDGARSGLWSEYARLIGELRPRYVVVENVAALLARGMGRVLGDLAEIGYDAEWDCIPASAVGAPHRRDRLWIVAYPNSDDGGSWGPGRSSPGGEGQSQPERTLQMADASRDAEAGAGAQSRAERERAGPSGESSRARDVADAVGERGGGRRAAPGEASRGQAHPAIAGCRELPNTNGPRPQGTEPESARGGTRFADGDWWGVEPDVGRVADGIPARVDRLRSLGNALVPQIAQWIGERIVSYERGES